MTDIGFKREALPQDLEGFIEEAKDLDEQTFLARRPYPLFLFARSILWEPALVMSDEQRKAYGANTRIANYDFSNGGLSFVSPIKGTQSQSKGQGIVTIGRSVSNDIILPVTSVSSFHAEIKPGKGLSGDWDVTDIGSKNGTFIQEDRLPNNRPTSVKDGQYLRFGGNLIAWFLAPVRFYRLLNHPEKLKMLTDL